MGTRNVTSVILNGKKAVCQYGQWDGYPTYTGTKILHFLRDVDRNQFEKALRNTSIHISGYNDAVTYTGSTKEYGELSQMVFEVGRKLQEQNNRWPEKSEIYDYLRDHQGVSEDDLDNYKVWTRDTGCEVLQLIYHRSLDKPPLELFALSDEYKGNYSWDIQGIYEINLDSNVIQMTYDEYSCAFSLDQLPTDIDKAMLYFENTSRLMYEKQDVLEAAKNLKPEELEKVAVTLAEEISKSIDPEDYGMDSEIEAPGEPEKRLVYSILENKIRNQIACVDVNKTTTLQDRIQQAEEKALVQDVTSTGRSHQAEK